MAGADADIAFRSIATLGEDYRRGALTPTAVAEACLERIERYDAPLNAIVPGLSADARAEAARAEDELAAGRDRGPLHGIPVGIKDLVDIAATVTGFGSDPVFATRAARDAAMVANLRAAGAVPIAKTNLLEFAYGAVNPRVGQTNNPWDTARTAGGSSGGSAAAVAAGLCCAAVGTDTGGSIRIPAAYCGRGGVEADVRPRAARRRLHALLVSRSRRADGAKLRRCGGSARRDDGRIGRCVAAAAPWSTVRAHRSAQRR